MILVATPRCNKKELNNKRIIQNNTFLLCILDI